ncbi:unnamed protein product [Acanthoscelides obtectus]|uniref:Uncharacterized protein n=1 Tax=Acanthoscelides obtectus TaxID=200917 RepID=A0A9P0MK46_ACAOB|nr:unnamed protein product [Acanthoscelides obtectus]CAH2015670.1 unnamed protein product [Acanthoscelides obtectus]CAK1668275.1 hypothetical protein AOBTE_LOCUS26309 [Acanthoscelides obtectus]CAK1668302.1 hypothetical protein AOBTE_LOCUS26320 [Acanthoscelides obtectus]
MVTTWVRIPSVIV